MSSKRRTSRITRRAVSAVAVITALASAAPVAQASAPAPALPLPALAALGSLQAFALSPAAFIGPVVAFAKGPTVIGDTFNGGTTVCVSTAASACSTNGSA
jgi:hypothetical protein